MQLIRRLLCLEKKYEFEGANVIKVFTGARSWGKQTSLRLMIDELKSKGVNEDRIVFMNFETNVYQGIVVANLMRS